MAGVFPDSMQWASPQQRASYLDQQNDAFGKQYQAEQAAKAQPVPAQNAPLAPHQELMQRASNPPAHVTTSYLDDIVNFADSVAHDGSWGEAATRVGRDATAGAVTGAANIADAGESLVRNGVRATYEGVAHPGQAALEAEDPAMQARDQQMDGSAQRSPIWEHARGAIMDFRDAVAVKDPNLVDSLTQGAAQLAVPFTGYSKALGMLGDAVGLGKTAEGAISAIQPFRSYLAATAKRDAVSLAKNVVVPGAATDATALDPHSARFADMYALGRRTEGKLGDVLKTIAPDGSAVNAYMNYLADRTDEGEAEGRFKNVLDGFGVNMIATPLLTAAASTLKQGTAGLRYMMDNGVGSLGDLPRPPAATQAGKIVFHGTPHDFDEFNPSSIGTGEGNATFGHGFYFAENPATGKYYRDALERRNVEPGTPMDSAITAVRQAGNQRDAYTTLTQKAAKSLDPEVRDNLTRAAELVRAGNANPRGTLMHVDIPDEHMSSMADWDAPLAKQPPLQQALADLKVQVVPENGRFRVMVNGKPGPQYLSRQAAMSETDLLRGESQDTTAGMAYNQLAEAMRSPKAASDYLAGRGIPGIRYLDQGSRGGTAGGGTRNIVLFDAKHAKIVKKE